MFDINLHYYNKIGAKRRGNINREQTHSLLRKLQRTDDRGPHAKKY